MESNPKLRRKSYTAGFKLNACRLSDEIGQGKAARHLGVAPKCIRDWKKMIPVLSKQNKARKSLRKKLAKWPDIELELRQWVINRRSMKARVTSTSLRLQAKVIARLRGIEDFKATNGWYEKFMKRAGLSMRCRTSVGQPLPTGWTDKLELFRAYVAEKKSTGDVLPRNLFNMDEVPCQFDLPGTRTIAERGEEDVTIVTTGSEKTSFTVVLGVSAEGEKLTPMVIFKRKTIPKEKFPSGVLVRANPKGWINGELVEDWMKNVWSLRKSEFFKKSKKENCLLVYDACTAHLTNEVKQTVEKYTQLAVIPGGLTKYLQPLDISVNKSFKGTIRNLWDEWMLNETAVSLTKGGNRRKATFSTVCDWIVKAWNEVTIKTIQNGFRKAGIHTYEATEEDEIENEMNFSEPENIENTENLNLILDEDSGDELLGDMFDGFAQLTLEN